jgi:hypothetical protein
MASSVSATTANRGNIEASQIDEIEATIADVSELNLEEVDTKALAEELSDTTKQEGLAGLIKTFVNVVTDLVKSLSVMMEKLSKLAPSTSKKAKDAAKKIASKANKSTTSKAKSKKPKTTVSIAKPKATAKITPDQQLASTPVTSSKETTSSVVEVPKITPAINEPNIASATTSASKALIDPALGYGDEYLSVITNKDGTPEVFTEDGYIIRSEGKEQAWTITNPDGKVTRIWGDPHVVESDGDKWDFKERSSFLFGNNKVTIETVPYGNGQTLTSKISIYNGDSRVSISGIDQDKPIFEAIAKDAELDDAIREDGDIFILGKEENGEDQFILLKDVAAKFDSTFAKQVGVDDPKIVRQYLTEEQLGFI